METGKMWLVRSNSTQQHLVGEAVKFQSDVGDVCFPLVYASSPLDNVVY